MPGDLSREEMRQVLKEAYREWLTDMFAQVGKWTVRGGVAAIVAAGSYWVASNLGWHR